MKNPFNPGSGVPPPYLAGREEHLDRFNKILDSIEDGHIENVMVYGLRGTGKTVLLDEFNKICIERNFLPIKRFQFSDKYRDSIEFEKALKYDIRVSIETFSKLSLEKNKVKTAISYLKPKQVGIPDVFYYEPTYEVSKDIPFEDHLEEYLSKNWPIFENAGKKGVVFLYDEFHNVFDDKQNKQHVLSDFLGAINEIQKSGAKYFLVLCGLPNLPLNVKEGRSYSERMFKSVQVANLDDAAAHDAIEKPLVHSGYNFEKKLVDDLCNETSGYPYFIQFYGKEIISNSRGNEVTLSEFEKLRPLVIKQLDETFFDPRYELASNDEQKVLCSMAKSSSDNVPFRFIKKNSKKTNAQVGRSLARLELKGMTYKHKHGMYRFSIPLFRHYLGRRCE
jgi:hypothetical protein